MKGTGMLQLLFRTNIETCSLSVDVTSGGDSLQYYWCLRNLDEWHFVRSDTVILSRRRTSSKGTPEALLLSF